MAYAKKNYYKRQNVASTVTSAATSNYCIAADASNRSPLRSSNRCFSLAKLLHPNLTSSSITTLRHARRTARPPLSPLPICFRTGYAPFLTCFPPLFSPSLALVAH